MFPSTGILIQRQKLCNMLCTSNLCLYVLLVILFIIVIYPRHPPSPHPHPMSLECCCLSVLSKLESRWNPEAGTLTHIHYSTKQKETQEGNWETHKAMSESVGKWAAGVFTGRQLSGVSLSAHSFWMHECKAVAKWSTAVQRVEPEVLINQDKSHTRRRESGAMSDPDKIRMFDRGDSECFCKEGICSADTAGQLSAMRRPAHITARNEYKEFGIIEEAKAV